MRALIFAIAVISTSSFAEPTYYAPFDKGGFIHLTDEPGIPSCPSGTKRAAETKVVLDQLKVIRELCYKVNDKRAVVELKDPDRYVLGTFTMPAAKFVRIPTKKERDEAEQLERSEALLRAIDLAYIQDEKNRQARAESARRNRPITCIRMGSDIMSCD